MKIGVMTFHQTEHNYGQMLQCWALQQVLKQLGHDPYVIRYGIERPYLNCRSLSTFVSPRGWKRVRHYLKENNKRFKDCKNRRFDHFRAKHLKLSKNVYNNLSQIQKHPPCADCYITGSDQVWAIPLKYIDNRAFFLEFGLPETKRVAYAASFARTDYPDEDKPLLADLLKKFDAIGVREKTGVMICQEIGATQAHHTIDPTLLLHCTDYSRLSCNPVQSTKYSFIYHVNIECAEEMRWIDFLQYNQAHNIRGIATFANPKENGNMEMLTGADYVYPTIEEWLGYIRNAQYVLTSSYHCVIFCILHHTPFVAVTKKFTSTAGNDRLIGLAGQLGLLHRIIDAEDSRTVEEVLQTAINWEDVDERLGMLRKDSMNFLKAVL